MFVEVQFNMIQNEKGTQAQDVNVVVAPEQASYFGEIKSFNPTKGRWDEEMYISFLFCPILYSIYIYIILHTYIYNILYIVYTILYDYTWMLLLFVFPFHC